MRKTGRYVGGANVYLQAVSIHRAQFRIEISKLKIKSDLLTLKNTHHKGKDALGSTSDEPFRFV